MGKNVRGTQGGFVKRDPNAQIGMCGGFCVRIISRASVPRDPTASLPIPNATWNPQSGSGSLEDHQCPRSALCVGSLDTLPVRVAPDHHRNTRSCDRYRRSLVINVERWATMPICATIRGSNRLLVAIVDSMDAGQGNRVKSKMTGLALD